MGKRNFEVHSESDIKEALVKVLELKPDYIFIAWDHPNPKVNQLPYIISQATTAPAVVYIMSNTKEASRRLNICKIEPKLYPPISGPAIERLILKFGKNAEQAQQQLNRLKANAESQKNLAEVRKNLLANLEAENDEITSEISVIEAEKAQEVNEQIIRNKSIDEKNNILQRSAKVNLSSDIINELKNSFETKVKTPLEELLENLAAANEISESENTASGIIIQQGFENPE
ncbi:MAG: hypothetical protein ABL930_11875, partial [Pseudobdellovibrio sp.]